MRNRHLTLVLIGNGVVKILLSCLLLLLPSNIVSLSFQLQVVVKYVAVQVYLHFVQLFLHHKHLLVKLDSHSLKEILSRKSLLELLL